MNELWDKAFLIAFAANGNNAQDAAVSANEAMAARKDVIEKERQRSEDAYMQHYEEQKKRAEQEFSKTPFKIGQVWKRNDGQLVQILKCGFLESEGLIFIECSDNIRRKANFPEYDWSDDLLSVEKRLSSLHSEQPISELTTTPEISEEALTRLSFIFSGYAENIIKMGNRLGVNIRITKTRVSFFRWSNYIVVSGPKEKVEYFMDNVTFPL